MKDLSRIIDNVNGKIDLEHLYIFTQRLFEKEMLSYCKYCLQSFLFDEYYLILFT